MFFFFFGFDYSLTKTENLSHCALSGERRSINTDEYTRVNAESLVAKHAPRWFFTNLRGRAKKGGGILMNTSVD